MPHWKVTGLCIRYPEYFRNVSIASCHLINEVELFRKMLPMVFSGVTDYCLCTRQFEAECFEICEIPRRLKCFMQNFILN